MCGLFSFALLLCMGLSISLAELPDYIHTCKASDPEIVKCITHAVNELRPNLRNGIPELDVPPLDPLLLDTIKLRRGVQSNITNLKVYGPSNFEILELKANIPKNKFSFKVNIPGIYFEGGYEIDMRILFLNIKGRGPIYGNLTEYYFDATMKGNKVIQDGEEYLKFEKMRLKVRLGKATLRLENLFNGDPTLGRATNQLITDNADIFLNEIKPTLENSLAEKFTDIANKITLKFRYKELFL